MADELDEGIVPDATPTDAELGDSSTSNADAAPTDGVQNRINELTKKRYDAERDAAYWRGVAESNKSTSPPPTAPEVKELDPEDFSSDADYLRAVAKQETDKIRKEAADAQTRQRQIQIQAETAKVYSAARAKYSDFDAVALNPTVPITKNMLDAAMGDQLGDVLYHLGKNPAEAVKIAAMNPAKQAKEIGKLEVRLASAPTKKTTSAPAPVPRVGSGPSPQAKSQKDMTRKERMAQWEADRRKRLGA